MPTDTIGLTIFLLKQTQLSAFNAKFGPNHPSALSLLDDLEGRFIPLPSPSATPRWVDAIGSLLQSPEALGLTSQTPAGLLVLPRGNRTFVVTFGYAWQKLDDSWVEPDFGRRVALNLIAKNGLVEIRAEQVFAKWHLASDRAPRASAVDDFGVEFDRDLVATVEGVPSNKLLGKTVRGGTSLRLTIPVSRLTSVLDKAESFFLSDAYKKHWPEIDNLSPVKNPETIASLEAQLNDDLVSGVALKTLVMFTPTYRRDDPLIVESYVFGRLVKSPAKRPYITVPQWLNYLAEKHLTPSLASARQTAVHMLDAEDAGTKTCTAFDCFGYEVSLGGRQYILSSGLWYEAVPEFMQRVNKTINKIEKSAVTLPAWNQTDSEGDYNDRCGHRPGFLHFDAKNTPFGGGQSKFEFCDFMHQGSRTLFFAKIVSKSSGMSHLVEQVRRTAELVFAGDSSFRKQLKKTFEKAHPKVSSSWLDSRPRPSDWNLCLVSLGRSKQNLPFFAKCALMKLHKDMTGRGHNVFFSSV